MSWFSDWWNDFKNGWQSYWNDGGAYIGDVYINNPWNDGSAANAAGAAQGITPVAVSTPSQNEADVIASEIPTSTSIDSGNDGEPEVLDTAINDALQGSVSISDYIKNHPGQDPLIYLDFMAQNSDEWAEKFLDYYINKKSIDEANAYTASREDTAYQRLVADLKAAGLNPAMMYGSTASTHAAGSAGVADISGGSNSRSISNFEKIKQIIMLYLMYNLKFATSITGSISSGMKDIYKLLS